jgi:hypothetical protein
MPAMNPLVTSTSVVVELVQPGTIGAFRIDQFDHSERDGYHVYSDTENIHDAGNCYIVVASEELPSRTFPFSASRKSSLGEWSEWTKPQFEVRGDTPEFDLLDGRETQYPVTSNETSEIECRFMLTKG